MALQTTASSGLSAEMKTFYDKVLLRRALPTLLHDKFAQKKMIPANSGKTVEFRKFATLGVKKDPLVEGVPFTDFQDISVSYITATPVQYGNAVGFSDLVSTVAIDPILTETTQGLGEQAGETMDEVIRDIIVQGTNVQYAASRAGRTYLASGDVLTPGEVRLAVLNLKVNRAKKIDGFYHAIIHPRVAHDLMNTTEWRDAQNYNQTGRIFDGSLGTLYGVKFWETDKAYTVANASNGSGSTGTVDMFATLFFGANAYAVVDIAKGNLRSIYKSLGSAGTADALDSQQTMGWKCMFTAKILEDAWMLRVESAASTAVNT